MSIQNNAEICGLPVPSPFKAWETPDVVYIAPDSSTPRGSPDPVRERAPPGGWVPDAEVKGCRRCAIKFGWFTRKVSVTQPLKNNSTAGICRQLEFIMICFYHSTTVVSAETSSAGVVAHGTILEGYGCGHVIRVTRVARPTGATRLSFYSPAVVDLFLLFEGSKRQLEGH